MELNEVTPDLKTCSPALAPSQPAMENGMADEEPTQISICMGSSCFSRGNRKNLGLIKRYLANHELTGKIIIKGHLCEGLCDRGPNIAIGDEMHSFIDSDLLWWALGEYFEPSS